MPALREFQVHHIFLVLAVLSHSHSAYRITVPSVRLLTRNLTHGQFGSRLITVPSFALADQQRQGLRFPEAACMRPDCEHTKQNEHFIERIIGRRPYDADLAAGVKHITRFVWLVKWDGCVLVVSVPMLRSGLTGLRLAAGGGRCRHRGRSLRTSATARR